MHSLIKSEIQKLMDVLQQINANDALLNTADKIAQVCVNALKQGKKVLFAGNGGSAADSFHA